MSETDLKQINIVAFDVPYPADYGGVIDIFYKIKALHKSGIKVHLHCFKYGRDHAIELEEYCESITYYNRSMSAGNLISRIPFIVKTRVNPELLKNLITNDYPVLFEGLHTTAYLGNKALNGRDQYVRTHNIEHEYYYNLAKSEPRIGKRLYLLSETRKLKKWEQRLSKAKVIFTISESDNNYFSKLGKSIYLPAFHSNEEVSVKPGSGDYILYHGNLSVQENIKAASYLIENLFKKIEQKVVITGKNPDKVLVSMIQGAGNISIVANPTEKELDELVSNAHINTLITFQATGIKLKLLYSLYNGRYCLVNNAMVENTGLSELCEVTEDPAKMIDTVNQLFAKELSEDEITTRTNVLERLFSNQTSIRIMIDAISF